MSTPTRKSDAAESRPRLSARTARYCLAREMWMRSHQLDHADAWDDDSLPTTVYERYIEMADAEIRKAMGHGLS